LPARGDHDGALARAEQRLFRERKPQRWFGGTGEPLLGASWVELPAAIAVKAGGTETVTVKAMIEVEEHDSGV
jgi:hypothetical protein